MKKYAQQNHVIPNFVNQSVSDWQNAVIGFFIFSLAFGLIATILTLCGVCTTKTANKIYYYHSAGEIYLSCGKYTTTVLLPFGRGNLSRVINIYYIHYYQQTCACVIFCYQSWNIRHQKYFVVWCLFVANDRFL